MSAAPAHRVVRRLAVPAAFGLFVLASFLLELPFGLRTADSFLSFAGEMVTILPPAFVLIGLFEAWIPRDRIERHLGHEAGFRSHFFSLLLAGTTVGGLMVAFPVAFALRQKGARYAVIFSYLGTAGVVRIPMTLFEMSFLGVAFTMVRYAAALPLLILMAEVLGRALERRGFEMRAPSST